MMAVSSFRPIADCTPEIKANQFEAIETWQRAFNRIMFLNEPDSQMNGRHVEFKPAEAFPRIKDMVAVCASEPGWSCIVNSDIVVRPTIFKRIESDLARLEAVSAISRRWEFDPLSKVRNIALVDLGLDIFCATQEVWRLAHRDVPDRFRIGHQLWDTWMIGFLHVTSGSRWYDFTQSRCILHPKHEDRQHPFSIDCSYRDHYLENVDFPKRKLQ